VQPEATRVSPDSYKSRCICPFDITAISETEDTSSTEVSTTSSTSNSATSTGSFQSHTTFTSSTSTMPRTKQTARKDRETCYPRATHPYICGLCRHESTQSMNHRRHMLTHHALRLDGTQATAEEIARARGWNVAGREKHKAARATETQTSSTAAGASSTTACTGSTTEHPSTGRIRSREFVSTDESEERPSTSSHRPTPAETAGRGSSRTTGRSHRSTAEHGSHRTTPALSDRDRSSAWPERPPPTVHSKVEVPRRKRARDDHTGRDATLPRHPPRLLPRVELTRQGEEPDLKYSKVLTPKEQPPVTTKKPPKKHQHPLPSTVGKKGGKKEPPSAALGAPPKSTSSTETTVEERHTQGESSTRGNDRAERPIATLVPRKPTESEALISLRQDLALSSSSAEEEEEEIPLVIDAGPPDWSDVEPYSDHEATVVASPRVELPPPPVYNQPDRPILIDIEEEQPAPSESAAETESTELLSPVEPPIEPLPRALSPMPDPTVRQPTRATKPHAPLPRRLGQPLPRYRSLHLGRRRSLATAGRELGSCRSQSSLNEPWSSPSPSPC